MSDSQARPDHAWTLKDNPKMNIGETAPSAFASAPLFSPWEAETRIEALEEFDVVDVGTSLWMKQHESLEQLNLQAHQSAQQQGDEFVLEALITFNKLKVLVHELLAIEAWRLNIYPRIKGGLAELKCTMRGYFCLFHEATLVNLLAVCLHHAHAVETLGETAVELVDYLARRLVDLNTRGRDWAKKGADAANDAKERAKQAAGSGAGAGAAEKKQATAEEVKETAQRQLAEIEGKAARGAEELEEQANDVLFQVSVGCATLTRYLCEHVNQLPLSVMVRATDTHDLLCLIIPILENPPWTRRLAGGTWQKLVENVWTDTAPGDLLTLTKTEAQVWLTLFGLICNSELRKRYHFNAWRKGQLLRARRYMNEVLLDQLPVLADVQRFMDELALMEVPQPTAEQGGSSVLMMEQVATTQEALTKTRDWEALAKDSLSRVFGAQTDATDADLKRLVDNVYGMEGVEDVLGVDGAASAALYAQPISAVQVCVLTHPGASEMLRVEYEPPPQSRGKKAGGSSAKVVQTAHGPFLRRRWVVPKATQQMTSASFDDDAANAAAAARQSSSSSSSSSSGSEQPPPPPPGSGLREVANMGCEVPFSRPGDGERVQAAVAAVENDPTFADGGSDGEGDEELRAVRESVGLAKGAVSSLSEDGTMPVMVKAELSFIGENPFNTAVATPMDEPVKFPADESGANGDQAGPQKMWVQLGALKDKLAIQVQLVRPSPGAAWRLDQCYISTPAPEAV